MTNTQQCSTCNNTGRVSFRNGRGKLRLRACPDCGGMNPDGSAREIRGFNGAQFNPPPPSPTPEPERDLVQAVAGNAALPNPPWPGFPDAPPPPTDGTAPPTVPPPARATKLPAVHPAPDSSGTSDSLGQDSGARNTDTTPVPASDASPDVPDASETPDASDLA